MLAYLVPLVKRQRVRVLVSFGGSLQRHMGRRAKCSARLALQPADLNGGPECRPCATHDHSHCLQIRAFEPKGKLAIVNPQRRASNFRLTIFD
jgi:hypothetical protein